MLEPWRSHYLRALGVDVYVPRRILPGAAISPACEWDGACLVAAEPAAPVSGDAAVAQTPVAAVVRDIATPTVVQRAPPPVPIIDERPAQRRENAAPPVSNRAKDNTAAQFALSVLTCDGGVLIIDDAPARNSARTEYLRLLGNLLFALRRRAIAPTLDIFIWPMVKSPQIDQSAQAAREALDAYVQKQIQNHAAQIVLLLGDGAQRWLPETARASWPAIHAVSISAWSCLSEPDLKRRLWQDLQHLAVPAP